MSNRLNQDFVISIIYMAAMFTSRNLEPIASVEWRDESHLKDAIKQYISESDWESFEMYWQDVKKRVKP